MNYLQIIIGNIEECMVLLCILGLLRGNEIYDMVSIKFFIIKIIQVFYVYVNLSNIYGGIVIYVFLDFNNF